MPTSTIAPRTQEAPALTSGVPRATARPHVILAAGLTAAALLSGYFLAFGTYWFYDDEGYFLVSLKGYAAGHPLYDQVFTQYGPLYYQVHSLVFWVLGLPFSHAAARGMVLVLWGGTAALLGLLVFRETRGLVLAAAAQLLAFGVLRVLADEPLHPGGMMCLALAGAALIATGFDGWPRGRRALLGTSALLGALVVVKVNVGVFAVLSLAWTLLAHARGPRLHRLLLLGASVVLPAVPFFLMRGLLRQDGVWQYALVVSLSLIPVAAEVLRSLPAASLPPRALAACSMALAAIPAVSLAGALLHGTRPGALLKGVLIRPLDLPATFCMVLDTPSAPFLWAGISLSLYCLTLLPALRRGRGPSALDALADWARLAASLGALASLAGLLPLPPMYLALPFLWLFLGTSGKRSLGRTFLVLLAGLQSLHAFPVAGSQIAFATFLLVPLAAISAWEAVEALVRRRSPEVASRRLATAAACAALALGLLSGFWTQLPATVRAYCASQRPLGLQGTAGMRLPEGQVALYRWLADNLKLHADTFVTLPGLNSLYPWSGLEPPTQLNTTVWMLLLDPSEQMKVVEALKSRTRACAVVQRFTSPIWAQQLDLEAMPLVRTILEDFRVAGSTMGYDFLVRKEREVPLVSCALLVPGDMPGDARGSLPQRGRPAALEIRPPPGITGAARASLVDAGSGEVLFSGSLPAQSGAGCVWSVSLPHGASPPEEGHGVVSPMLHVVRLESEEGRILASLPVVQ